MENRFTLSQEVVCDNSPMTSPPYGLSAHNGTALRVTEIKELREAVAKTFTHRVVGIVVKAVVLPKRIDACWHIAILAAQTTKCRNMPVSNSERFERLRQRLVVILRVGARAWHGPNIGDERYLCVLQQIYKFINWARRVANSVERVPHAQNALVFIEHSARHAITASSSGKEPSVYRLRYVHIGLFAVRYASCRSRYYA